MLLKISLAILGLTCAAGLALIILLFADVSSSVVLPILLVNYLLTGIFGVLCMILIARRKK
ncbi:MAG: hypothetical protein FWE38_04930 [Firmicutes bacterium]|nr:hypothetical protein [Bacillota bacterium]